MAAALLVFSETSMIEKITIVENFFETFATELASFESTYRYDKPC